MTSPTHFSMWLFVAPIALVVILVLIFGLGIRGAARRRKGSPTPPSTRGPVSGGTIEGDPGQRNLGRHEALRTDRPQDTREDEPGG
jgi:hypothetical protein